MNSPEIDENALDSEALQAQIDLSMSFAQGLVSSWMAPHKFPTNTRKKDLEKELTEYMRQPPRLGVGASVPEGHQSFSRETARLKGQLIGSKRSREQEEEAAAKQAFDEEGESRTVAIKKKARPDPFDVVHGKKKKKQKMTEITSPSLAAHLPENEESKNDSPREVEDVLLDTVASPKANGSSPANSLPVKRKKKIKKAAPSPNQPSIGSVIPASVSPPVDKKLYSPDSRPDQTPEPTNNTLPKAFSTPNVSSKTLPPALANIPLLNLTGFPSDGDSDAEHGATTSPKKKRKRRKKKKSHDHVNSNSGDTIASANQLTAP